MAVTRLWKVTDNLDRVIDYAEDENKTRKPKFSDKDWQSLKDVLEYAKDEEKTEQQFYVSGINCNPDNAREQFIMVKEQYNKTDGMKGYWAVINSFGAGVTIKLTINNHKLDKAEFEKAILIPYKYDELDKYRKEYNEMLLDKANSSNCIVQDKYFTVTVSKRTVEDSRAFFNRIGNDLTARLSRIGSKCEPLTADDRLRILHDFYRAGNEQNYNLDIEQFINNGCDVRDLVEDEVRTPTFVKGKAHFGKKQIKKDEVKVPHLNGELFKCYICPDSMEIQSDYMKINNEYCRTIFLRNYGTFVEDSTISDLASINRNLMLSIDFIPIPAGEAVKEVDKVLLGIQTDKANYNRKQVQNNNFGATNYDLEQREAEILEIKNDI